MFSFYVVLVSLFSLTLSLPINIEADDTFLLAELADIFQETPLEILAETLYRAKRQVYGGLTPGSPGGVNAMVGTRGTLYQNNDHRLDGNAQVSKNFLPTGPTNVQGGLDYTGRNVGANIGASHTHGFGTDVNAGVSRNLWRSNDGLSTVTGAGTYNRHFGGPFGTGRPQYGGSLMYSRRF